MDRWLEVVVGAEVLTPRQLIGSVPWAMVAERANEVVRDPDAPRFEDCGDGTVADHQTGLQWGKKTGTMGTDVVCDTAGCPDPHIVNNRYYWSNTGSDPDGDAFTDFLAKLNDPVFGTAANSNEVTGCFAGHCDWRLPNVVEQKSILDCVNFSSPCLDPIFGPIRWSTVGFGDAYWGASTRTGIPTHAFHLEFNNGFLLASNKLQAAFLLAVRAGSCN